MRWRLILEEFGPELRYVPGDKNIVADALSRLDLSETELDTFATAEFLAVKTKDIPKDAFPVRYSLIEKEQQADNDLTKKLGNKVTGYSVNTFRGGDKSRKLIMYKNKIVVPASMQKRMVEWYHLQLCHPGETRTEASIRQHFWWKNLRQEVHKQVTTLSLIHI